MTNQATQKQEEEKEPIVDMESILRDNNLQLVETEFFRQKKTVARVKDAQGNCLILKTGRIDPFQVQLLKTAKQIETQLYFKVPAIIRQSEGWILLEEVDGQFINDFYDKKPDWCVEVSKKVADSYQLVIQEVQKTQPLGNLLVDGQEWLFSRLNMWSKPIVDAGLIDFSLVQQLKTEFEEVIAKKGDSFFGWVHGNVIGDHILVSGEEVYLIDLNAVPRAGRGYHDFLRALDFMFLKASDEEQMFTSIQRWMKQYLSEFDEAEVKLVFAFRNIGILGWDILHHNVEYTKGDVEAKKRLALKFINREY
jgi:tRNA A-37 threonylcarbamoyl transferase component Bud32